MEEEEDSEFMNCIRIIMSNATKNDEFRKSMDLLNIKDDQFNIIHVSGTNGKSSVSYKVSNCLISLGKKVGLFTSPHLFEYNERIRVQDVNISNQDLVRITTYILSVIGDTPVHFFSFFLLISLVYFIEKNVDWVVLETGIGGLFDTTNFAPNTKVVVITSIGYDHMQMLGKTLDEIAFQKAGTIKKGSVVVLGPNCHNDEIFEMAARDVGARVIKNTRRDFKSFDEENTETSRIVIEEALKIGTASSSGLGSRLMMRMQILTLDQCKAVKSLIFSKYPPLYDKIDQYGLPGSVVMDIAHNQTAIKRLCTDIFKIYSGNLIFCLAISLRRRLSIFNTIAPFKNDNDSGRSRSISIYYLNLSHSYCRKLEEVKGDLEGSDFSPEDLFKTGLERSRAIISSETSDFYHSNEVTDEFDKVLYNAFIESCKRGDVLVLTGTAYMMDQSFSSMGFKH